MIESLFCQGLIAEDEEVLEFRGGELGQSVLAGADDRTGDLALDFDDLVDFFLERSAADQLVKLNVVYRTDSECSVHCLVLDGGVPPPVEMEDMIGGCQVQPRPAGLEREDEETRSIAAARRKAIYHPVALALGSLSM
jgi:hypothetical protein